MTRRNYQKLGYVILVALILGIVPLSQARAFDFLGVGDIANSAIVDMLTFFLSTIFAIVGQGIAIAAKALNITVNIRVGADIPVVSATWKIFRDFANMLFIIILIYMAFATIFDWSKYRFKDMFWRFLIVAVFINFSLTIGGLIIDACQVLTNLFLGSIGDIGVRLGQYLNPTALFIDPKSVSLSAGDLLGSQLISMIFSLVLALIFLFSLLTAFIFTFIRVPYIWGLLIATPFFWMGHMFPGSKYGIRQWWNQFLGWNLFLPVYLFFLYISLYFLSKRDEIMNAVIKVSGPNSPLNQPLIGTLEKSLTFNLLFFYIFVAASLVVGAGIAIKTTSMISGSNAFEKGYKWAQGWVKRAPIIPWAGGPTTLDAVSEASKKRFGQFKQEGFQNPYLNKMYGGEAAQEKQRNRVAASFGVRGADTKFQRQFTEAAQKAFSDITEEYDLGRIDIAGLQQGAQKYRASDPRGFAYRKQLAKIGQMDNAMYFETLRSLKGNPYAAQDFAKAAKESKFSGVGDIREIAAGEGAYSDIRNSGDYLPARREMFKHIQSDAATLAKLTSPQFDTAIAVFGGGTTNDAKAFIKDVAKVRPDLTIPYTMAHPVPGAPAPVLNNLWDAVFNADAKDIANMPKSVWDEPSRQFEAALGRKLNGPPGGARSRAQTKLRDRYLSLLLSVRDGNDKATILQRVAP